jgi:hypothetical protein
MKTVLLVCASGYLLCATAFAQGYPAAPAQTDVSSATNRQPAAIASERPAPQSWNDVPSYLLRKDGMLINGLGPTSPDAQG